MMNVEVEKAHLKSTKTLQLLDYQNNHWLLLIEYGVLHIFPEAPLSERRR